MTDRLKQIMFGDVIFAVKAIGFDKDGTLFDSIHFWQYIDGLRKNVFLDMTGGQFAEQWSSLMGFKHPDEVDYNGVLATATTQEEIILVAGLLFTTMGLPWYQCKERAAYIFENADRLMQAGEAFRPQAGVPAVFDELAREGVSTGILTSDQMQRTEVCIELIGMQGKLDFIITPEKVLNGKPAADMVFVACNSLGIEPREMAVVGDSIMDLKMAKAAGSYAIGLITYEGSEKILAPYADHLIKSIADIRPMNRSEAG